MPLRFQEASGHNAGSYGNSDLLACFNMLIIHLKQSQQTWVQKVLRREPCNWITKLFKMQRMKFKTVGGKKNEIKIF